MNSNSNKEELTQWATRIGMLRQWLNEDRITEPKRMVTNEQLEYWLKINELLEQAKQEALKENKSVRGYQMGYKAGSAEERTRIKDLVTEMKKDVVCSQDNKPGMHYECDCSEQISFNAALNELKSKLEKE